VQTSAFGARGAVAALVAVRCGAATVWAAQAGSPAGGARIMLPDLSPQSPGQLTVRAVPRDGLRRFRLGFRSAADNLGPGALVVEARRHPRRRSLLATTQVVTRGDGSLERRPLPATLSYVRSADHGHWHYLGFMRCELRRPGGGRRLGRDNKTGFCLGDRYPTPSSRPPRGRRGPAAFSETDCGKGSPGLTTLHEGISVGYGDELRRAPRGPRSTSPASPLAATCSSYRQPGRSLAELTYENNTSRALIRIAHDARGRPTAKLLR
jgi:hypothetical protein